ncbi:MAG: methanogenesis marker 15 protein [Candidatus Syntrophoarchaeum sp.]|nr:methanogenesis marker 15 protein [Candidatus Syntrophoarchaeum sp.]
MEDKTRIAQISCGTEYSGVQAKLNEVADRSGIKLIYPEVELEDVADAVSEFGYLAKSPGLNLMIARAKSVVEDPSVTDGIFLLTCFKCAEGSIVKNEVRKYLQQKTDLPVVTYSTVDQVKEGGLMIRFEALKTLVTRKTLLMRTRQEGITMGVDSGSSTTKCVIMKENEIVGTGWVPTTDVIQSARKVMDLALKEAGMKEENIEAVAVTGYGRHTIGDEIKADLVQEELTVNSKGAAYLADRQRGEATVLDIGGMDNKALTLNNAIPDDFTMGGVCAGASGRFLEITARRLGVDISELGKLALQGESRSIQMDSYCSIFGIQSLVSALGEGSSKEDVAAAACRSVAEQVHEQQLQEIDLREPIIEVGGTALIEGLKAAFEEILGFDIIVPPYPQFAGAVGGALIVSAFVK